MKKGNFITILVILAVIILAVILIVNSEPNPNNTDEELAKCLGEKSTLYIQLGCHACKTQTDMFGENAKFLTIVDCFYEREKCGDITATPTWVIKGEQYKGTQSIEKLKELTGC